MANEYVTSVALKKTLKLENETFADDDIAAALVAASRAIDRLCGQRFYTTGSDETRYFTATGDRVWVRALQSLTSLASDSNGNGTFSDTWTVNSDFTYEPVNATLDGQPYQWVVRHPRGQFYFPAGYPRAVRIVGKFGWTTAPSEVVEATSILAAKLFKRSREAPFGVVTVGLDVGAVARIGRTDPDVQMLLQPFMDAPFA